MLSGARVEAAPSDERANCAPRVCVYWTACLRPSAAATAGLAAPPLKSVADVAVGLFPVQCSGGGCGAASPSAAVCSAAPTRCSPQSHFGTATAKTPNEISSEPQTLFCWRVGGGLCKWLVY